MPPRWACSPPWPKASATVKDWLNWNSGVGPLSGKTILAVAVWIVAWAVLHLTMRGKRYETRPALIIALMLIGLGVLGTFPTFFELFAPTNPPTGRRDGCDDPVHRGWEWGVVLVGAERPVDATVAWPGLADRLRRLEGRITAGADIDATAP